jgi:Protein of unknown function (DUF3761)
MATKRIWAAALVGASLISAVGCGSSESRAVAAPAGQQSVQSKPLSSASARLQAAQTTTALKSVDAGLVADCVDYVQFGAYTGNQLLLAMWDQAGRSVPTLRNTCESVGRSNAQTLQGMSKQWQDIKTWRAAVAARPQISQTTPTRSSSPPQTGTPSASPPSTGGGTCSGGYINVDGNCIPRPRHAPSVPVGATAQCRDGTYSFSAHHQGTCSHHGGVATWL